VFEVRDDSKPGPGLRTGEGHGVTQVVMSACTTSRPDRSVTLTGTTSSVPSVNVRKSGSWICAVARIDVVAFSRYRTFIAFGIQRCDVGTVASISMPIAISAALHDAMACTVRMWFCTNRQFGMVTTANPGSIRTTWGSTEAKYGTLAIAARENSLVPMGMLANRCQAR
jgi:hypothetical protein